MNNLIDFDINLFKLVNNINFKKNTNKNKKIKSATYLTLDGNKKPIYIFIHYVNHFEENCINLYTQSRQVFDFLSALCIFKT